MCTNSSQTKYKFDGITFHSIISLIVYLFKPSSTWWWGKTNYPWMERYHYPGFFTSTPSPYVNGTDTKISSTKDTPDWRIEEPHFVIRKESFAKELDRPYRNSPPFKQSRKIWWSTYWKKIEKMMGCYCCTTYRKFTLLAGCAVITTRHVLTTATPTALILRSYSHLKSLEGILGGWYDTDVDSYNSSMYMSVARIHFHPLYVYDYEVNVSHPIPAIFDLAIWAATYPFYGSTFSYSTTIICPRAASAWREFTHTIPRQSDLSVVAGFMFMKSYKRRPLPWFRYIVKTQNHVWPCPKSDWQWFHCIQGEYWGRFGFDSGGGMNTAYRGKKWRNDGMAGICAFSMKLRSIQTTHYFTVVDCYPVLNFMYDAFLGLKKPVYLDDRFEDTKWGAPVPWWGEYIWHNYNFGEQVYYNAGNVPKYRR